MLGYVSLQYQSEAGHRAGFGMSLHWRSETSREEKTRGGEERKQGDKRRNAGKEEVRRKDWEKGNKSRNKEKKVEVKNIKGSKRKGKQI